MKVDRLENPQNEFVLGAVKGASPRGQNSRELIKLNVCELPEPFPDLKKKKKDTKYDNMQIMLESGGHSAEMMA